MSNEKPIVSFSDSTPTAIFQCAIKNLELFAQQDVSDLKIKEDGSLSVEPVKPLKKIIERACNFIRGIFSNHDCQRDEEKLIKELVLWARDTAQSHSSLIEKLESGDPAQQKLAQWARAAIKQYNAAVAEAQENASSWTKRYAVYNKNRLLLDEEIKGKQIELPYHLLVKCDSYSDTALAQKTLKRLSETFSSTANKEAYLSLSPKLKQEMQMMVEAFRIKATRAMKDHLAKSPLLAEVLQLINHVSIDMEDKDPENIVAMRQVLEIAPGAAILLTGSFKRSSVGSKLMSIPIVEDGIRHSLLFFHTGFPYPADHTSWALSGRLVDASPLRSDQVALFYQVEQHRKQLTQSLFLDPQVLMKARYLFKLKREVFDNQRSIFIPLHRRLQEAILEASGCSDDYEAFLDQFYDAIKANPSPFNDLSHIQQRIIRSFIELPASKLQEQWLETGDVLLRTGSYQEKYLAAIHLMQTEVEGALAGLNTNDPIEGYISLMGKALSQASQAIILQYMSEKIGFPPPMLDEYKRKIQACAFHQLVTFLEEMEKEVTSPSDIQERLINHFKLDTDTFKLENPPHLNKVVIPLINQLEVYSNSRFYMVNRK